MTRTTVPSPEELASARPGAPLDEAQAGIPARVADRIRRGDTHRDVLDFLVAELHGNFPAHAWSGVYLVEGETLVLGPEIVVPIEREGAVLGVIDVDSEVPDAFTRTDLDARTEVARLVATIVPPPSGVRA